jgi:hypothetical protein
LSLCHRRPHTLLLNKSPLLADLLDVHRALLIQRATTGLEDGSRKDSVLNCGHTLVEIRELDLAGVDALALRKSGRGSVLLEGRRGEKCTTASLLHEIHGSKESETLTVVTNFSMETARASSVRHSEGKRRSPVKFELTVTVAVLSLEVTLGIGRVHHVESVDIAVSLSVNL